MICFDGDFPLLISLFWVFFFFYFFVCSFFCNWLKYSNFFNDIGQVQKGIRSNMLRILFFLFAKRRELLEKSIYRNILFFIRTKFLFSLLKMLLLSSVLFKISNNVFLLTLTLSQIMDFIYIAPSYQANDFAIFLFSILLFLPPYEKIIRFFFFFFFVVIVLFWWDIHHVCSKYSAHHAICMWPWMLRDAFG